MRTHNPYYARGESRTYILNEDTQPVIRAIGVSHTACKDEFRQNIRSHSWSVFSLIYFIHNVPLRGLPRRVAQGQILVYIFITSGRNGHWVCFNVLNNEHAWKNIELALYPQYFLGVVGDNSTFGTFWGLDTFVPTADHFECLR